ncbi:hypothetical protein EI427_03160 [Flammeovirga pectinis]|uniref:Uncharacterized protein n=1 Tax=Flammeovirga pectinis TaxID=2494373 RepID=A0A3S9NZ90_9BACT|nr:hypothetical protein [Flammeovirga pectinis]AZQ61253.1 hypothetical protein EI427_03160 [Flammeovirga pectinis]
MEKNWNFLLLSNLFLVLPFLLTAQTLEFEVEVGEIATVDIDRNGKVYVVDHQGNVAQWVNTTKERWYSPQAAAEVQIDAWAMLNTILFSPDWQAIRILGQQLTVQSEYIFSPELVEYASVATNATDGGIWLYDQSAFRMKKYYPSTESLSINVELERLINGNDWNPIWMKEFQNNLYVLDELNGVYTFDLLGNILSMPYNVKGATLIGLTAKEMYWLEKGKEIHFKELYGVKTRVLELPLTKVEAILFNDSQNRIYCFKNKKMYAYQL